MTPELSIVVPVYNESECLNRFHAELSAALRSQLMTYEILYVDDGSTDSTLGEIETIQKNDPTVAAVILSRNFGHQAALTAGLELARGKAVITMDGDLQHPPELILSLIDEWREGAKVVHTVRADTAEIGAFKSLASRLYYRLLNFLSSTPIEADAADFRLLDRQAVEMLKTMNERHRFLRGMIQWLGLPEAKVRFTAPKRFAGKSKFTWRKMFRMGADGIVSFSTKPLRAALWLGLAVLAVCLAYTVYVFYQFFFNQAVLRGWTSLILLTTFLGSSQLILLGVVGEYIGRIYEEAKSRPLFLVREIRSPARR